MRSLIPFAQRVDRVEQIVTAGADKAGCRGDCRRFLDRHWLGVIMALRPGDESRLPVSAEFRMQRQPLCPVGHGDHLAAPQQVKLLDRLVGIEPEGDAGTASAAIQRKDKPGTVRRAASQAGPQAEPAMMAENPGLAPFHIIDDRVEDQASVTKDPDVFAVSIVRDKLRRET